jgi:hypothetical protein
MVKEVFSERTVEISTCSLALQVQTACNLVFELSSWDLAPLRDRNRNHSCVRRFSFWCRTFHHLFAQVHRNRAQSRIGWGIPRAFAKYRWISSDTSSWGLNHSKRCIYFLMLPQKSLLSHKITSISVWYSQTHEGLSYLVTVVLFCLPHFGHLTLTAVFDHG